MVENMKKFQSQINLQELQYNRPNIITLIDPAIKPQKIEDMNIKQQARNILFKTQKGIQNNRKNIMKQYLAYLRGIMDSKFNEMIVSETGQISRFADFFYSWWSKFMIDQSTLQVVYAEQQIESYERKMQQFILILIEPIMKRHWESVTFNNFLNEQNTTDEVYFYLYYRNMLLEGNSLRIINQQVSFHCFIDLKKAISFIRFVFSEFDDSIQQFLENILKNNSDSRYLSKDQVEIGFILKIMLDFYIDQKKRLCYQIFELFNSDDKKSLNQVEIQNQNIELNDFLKIMNTVYPSIQEIQKIQIYRETYLAGSGKVNAWSFFIAANETNFFISIMKLKTVNEYNQIKIQNFDIFQKNFENNRNKEIRNKKVFIENQQKLLQINQLQIQNSSLSILDDQYLNQMVHQLGVEQQVDKLFNFKQYFKFNQFKQTEKQDFRSQIHSFLSFIGFLNQVNQQFLHNSGCWLKIGRVQQLIKTGQECYEKLREQIRLVHQQNDMIQQRRQKAAFFIQKNIKLNSKILISRLNRMIQEKSIDT